MQETEYQINQDELLQVAAGNEAAFARLFHAYRDKLYSFILGISGSGQLAEDIVQEVFLKIWKRRAELTYIREFDAYLFRMARNHSLNALKRMAKESLVYQQLEQLPPPSMEVLETLELKEMQASVHTAIEKMSGRQKEVFMLSRHYGLKQAEISRLLHITVPTVKSHITQAMLFIKKQCKYIYPVIKIYLLFLTAISH